MRDIDIAIVRLSVCYVVVLYRNSLTSRSCTTSDLVNTKMRDLLRAGKPSWYETSHPDRLSLLPFVGQ